MNTIRSVGYGWGVLIAAGGGAYIFAKRDIDRSRQEKAEADRKKRALYRRMEEPQYDNAGAAQEDIAGGGGGNPSHEANEDPAPTRHAPETKGERAQEKSKYEASESFRSRKGDRFT